MGDSAMGPGRTDVGLDMDLYNVGLEMGHEEVINRCVTGHSIGYAFHALLRRNISQDGHMVPVNPFRHCCIFFSHQMQKFINSTMVFPQSYESDRSILPPMEAMVFYFHPSIHPRFVRKRLLGSCRLLTWCCRAMQGMVLA